MGGDEVEKQLSDLGCGTVIFGVGTSMEDGPEGTTLEAGRQAEVAAFCL